MAEESGLSVNTGLVAAGTGMEVAGAIVQAVEAQRIGKYNARVARANAQAMAFADLNEAAQHERLEALLGEELSVIEAATTWQVARLQEQAAQQLGMQRAILGASGLALEGSPLAVLEAQARQFAIQELAVGYQAKLQQRALREEQTQQTYAATLARFQAGERLRLGGQQAGMVRVEASERTRAGLFEAAGAGIKGTKVLQYLTTRQKLASSGSTTSTAAATPEY